MGKEKAGTKGKSSKSQKKGSLFGVTFCIQAGGKMKGFLYASVAASFVVPGIGLPPEEHRHRDAVATGSCLFMFIGQRHGSGAAWAAYGKGNGSQGNN